MDVISPFLYFDPSLDNIDLLGVNENFNATDGDELGTLMSDTDLDQILDIDQIPITTYCDPSNRVWNAQEHDENIRLLRRNSTLAEFPFPPVVIPCTDAKTTSGQAPLADPFLPPTKRRGRKRKAPPTEAEKEVKRRKFLERNRLAASKCRAKRKDELNHIEEKRRVLERENLMLRKSLRNLRKEVRIYREATMAHDSCNHLDMIELAERNTEFPAAMNTLCHSFLGEKQGKEGSDGRGSPTSSSDNSPLRTSMLSEAARSAHLSTSPLTSSPPLPASTSKGSMI